ncbi:MAG: DUF799 family lipoprotein, partial [Planctomycetes bacterium]|nr:DUF799 family lipoprotein [Planctomycetota bacterium]
FGRTSRKVRYRQPAVASVALSIAARIEGVRAGIDFVAVVDAVLKQNGVPLPPEMHQVSLEKLRDVFHPDAVLYVTIKKWTTTFLLLDTTTTVVLDYRLIDLDSNIDLWRLQQTFQYSPSRQQSGLAGKIAVAIVHAAQSGSGRIERDVAVRANRMAFYQPRHGLLTGARHPDYEKDLKETQNEQAKLEQERARAANK